MHPSITFSLQHSPALFVIRGADCVRYLHGRLTQDIKGLAIGQGARSLLLTPQGKILGHMLVLREAEGVSILTDPLPDENQRAQFVRDLLQFKVADDVQLEDYGPKMEVLSLFGDSVAKVCAEVFEHVPQSPWAHTQQSYLGAPVTLVCHPLGLQPRFDIMVAKDNSDSLRSKLEHAAGRPFLPLSVQDYERLRIMAKRPSLGKDINEKTLAADIDLEELVSFRKGCYAGQEVVEMATARGRPNRKLVLLTGQAEKVPEPACNVYLPHPSGEPQLVGTITSSAPGLNPKEWCALALLKSSVSDESTLNVGGHDARIS